MQAGVGSRSRGCKRFFILLAALSIGSFGCGGGTTGTSSVDTFKLLGVTESAQGAPLSETSMSVLSAQDESLLVESQTDISGAFSMDLPQEEEAVIVDVNGVKSSPLKRMLSGESVVSTKLAQKRSGQLLFAESFEVQIRGAERCQAVEILNNQILINPSSVEGSDRNSCIVEFAVRATGLQMESLMGELRTDCQVETVAVAADPQGVLSIDLTEFISSGCSNGEISIAPRNSSLSSAIFKISKLS
jgi:hypothetical protein